MELAFDLLPHGAINCAIQHISELGNSNPTKVAREARTPNEIHPNGKEE
jgi:hypothetical protein